jgi:hypothetical protein
MDGHNPYLSALREFLLVPFQEAARCSALGGGNHPVNYATPFESIEILLTWHSIEFICNHKFYMDGCYAPVNSSLLHRRLGRPDHHG